jgi:hypothetical protein
MLTLPTYLGQVGDTGIFRVSLGSLGLTSLGLCSYSTPVN